VAEHHQREHTEKGRPDLFGPCRCLCFETEIGLDSGNSPMSCSYSYNPEIWPALITLATAVYLGSYLWSRRHIPAAKPFIIACFLAGLWSLGVILQLSAVHFSTKVFWVEFTAIWQLPVGGLMACFVLQYSGLGRWLNLRTYALLFIVPLLSVLVIVTNDSHHLMWTGFRMERHVVSTPGRLYWAFHSYVYLLGIVNFAALIRLAIRSPGHRLPVAIIMSGQILGRVGYAIDKLGWIGPGESAFFTMGVVAVAYAVAFLRFHVIDPVAAARTVALQQMSEGFFVLDLRGRIADVNPVGAAISGIPEKSLRQKLLKEVMPLHADILEELESRGTGKTEITLEKGDSARQYMLTWTALKGRRGEEIGRLILLHDVTEQRRAQARILEQRSVVATLQERERLARELHDGIGQTLGYVSVQAQSALKWLQDGNSEKTESLLARLVEVAKDAHADVRGSILSLKTGSGREWSFIPALKEYMDKFQAHYGIRTELTFACGIDEDTFDPAAGVQLLRAIQEALTNARKHSGASTLRVCVERVGAMAQISITDNGNGFDTTRLEHWDDGHFGLVFMRERMAQIGGSLKIESAPGGGTALRLDAPIVK
jgi:signal transduction histidine kinase